MELGARSQLERQRWEVVGGRLILLTPKVSEHRKTIGCK